MLNSHKGRFFITFITLVFINLYCLNININADTSFPLRYVSSIFSGDPFLIFVQPGNRFFPEIVYSVIAYAFTDKLIPWSRIVISINTIVLAHSVYFLSKSFNLNENQSLVVMVSVLLSIPLFTYFHDNVLIYFVFSPGIHGFLIPYTLYAISLSYLINYKQVRAIHIICYVIIVALCTFSDSSFLLAAICPVLSFIILSLLSGMGPSKAKAFYWLMYSLLGLFVAYALMYLVPDMFSESFYFMELNYALVGEELLNWLEHNNLFSQLLDREISGYLFEFIVITLLTSAFIVIKKIVRSNVNIQVLYINFIYFLWFPFFLYAMWAVEKSNLRLVPFIILATPIVFTINVVSLIKPKINYDSVAKYGMIFLLIGTLGLMNSHHISMPYYQHDTVFFYLEKLKKDGIINNNGLSEYWIANIDDSSDFEISPLNANAYPSAYASNILKSWNWIGNRPEEKLFTFIVNKCSSKCVLEEEELIKRYGQFDELKKVRHKSRVYNIYIYYKGLDSSFLYKNLERKLNNYNKEAFNKYLKTNG